jgi:spermidine/putrescine transport system substrate-binding protein
MHPHDRAWSLSQRLPAVFNKLLPLTLAVLLPGLSMACGNPTPPATSTPPPLTEELVFFDWAGDLIETVFDDFTAKYGVKVTYLTYESPEAAVENIRAGAVYDVVVLENQYIPALVAEGLLAQIDYRNVPNFKNVSANFRDMAYDPGNEHSIPYSWGTTGLVVRSDLVEEPVTRWADLWDPRYAGKVIGWKIPRYMLSATLKSLGYSINSEDPEELENALDRLLALKPDAIWLTDEESSAPLLVSDEAVMALGWAYDVWVGRQENEEITYVLPQEGTILWGDNFVIPANSPHKYTAELFLNFILRPEIAGRIVNENYYPMSIDAADPYIDQAILNDPVVFPTSAELKNAEIMLPLSPAGERLHAEIWERFLATQP